MFFVVPNFPIKGIEKNMKEKEEGGKGGNIEFLGVEKRSQGEQSSGEE